MSAKIPLISVGGGWVSNTRHLPALLQSGLFDVIGVVSKHPDRAERTAKRHGIAKFGTKLDFSIDWQQPAAAVMIGSNPQAHYDLIKIALHAGKHVLCEKPITVDPRHADELRDLAREKKLVLAAVHNFQFARASMKARQAIAAGRIGRIQAVYGVQLSNEQRAIHDWCDQLPLGLFYDEAPHFFYMFRWISGGELTLLDASVWPSPPGRNTPRLVSAEYRAGAGFPVYLHINFDASLTEWHITIVGDKGTIGIDLWRDIYVELPNDGVHTAKDILRTSVLTTVQHLWGVFTGGVRYARGVHLYGNDVVVRKFHRAIQGEDALKGMDIGEGTRVILHMHEIVEKARYVDGPKPPVVV